MLLNDRSLSNQKDRLSNQIDVANQDFCVRLVDKKTKKTITSLRAVSAASMHRSSRVHFDPFPPLVRPDTQVRLNLVT